ALTHAGTFNNNVLSMSAGTVARGEIFADTAAEELRKRGDGLREALTGLGAQRQVARHFGAHPRTCRRSGCRAAGAHDGQRRLHPRHA
ncbi:MAG: hypothetical protein ACK5TQ_20725, partial [Acetobacteraceae bacterium]